MKAGRELDALIAEKVMGLTKQLVPKGSLPNSDVPGATFPREDGWLFVGPSGFAEYFQGHVNDCYVAIYGDYRETVRPVPFYSEDIAAAWAVVGRMAQVHKMGLELNTGRATTTARFSKLMDGEWAFSESQSPAPHAICLAALKAVEA